jgi:hypothetical protein
VLKSKKTRHHDFGGHLQAKLPRKSYGIARNTDTVNAFFSLNPHQNYSSIETFVIDAIRPRAV